MIQELLHQLPISLEASLVARFPTAMAALVRPRPDAALAALVLGQEPRLLATLPAAPRPARNCLRAALWLLADDLDRAHALCQEVPEALGSAWHAHLHRREPDAANALYWWRRATGLSWDLPTGTLAEAVLARLAAATGLAPADHEQAHAWQARLGGGRYEPAAFVGQVDHWARRGGSAEWQEVLRDVQRLEWLSLFFQTLRFAGAPS